MDGRSDKGKIRKNAHISQRAISMIKREVRRKPLGKRKDVFENVGVPDVPTSTRCRILHVRTVAKCADPEVRPPVKDIHKQKRMECARNHSKVNFQTVLITDESRATLDKPDGWRKGWYCNEGLRPYWIRRQRVLGCVKSWAGIIGNELV